MAATAVLDFQKFDFLWTVHLREPICITVPNFIKIGHTVAEIWLFNFFFPNGGRPPSWNCWALIGTTHDNHLVVSVVVPNLAKIDAVVLII